MSVNWFHSKNLDNFNYNKCILFDFLVLFAYFTENVSFKIFVAFFSQEIVCLIFCHSSEHILISLNRYEIATGGRTVNYAKKSSFLLPCILFRLWYFNFEPSFKLRWCRAQDLFGLQTPVATGGFVLVITCLREKFRINLLSLLFWNFEISRVKRGFKLSKSSHGSELHKKQSININKFNKDNSITPTPQ